MDITPHSNELSPIPSVGVRQVLAELIAIEQDPRYTIDMSVYHVALQYDPDDYDPAEAAPLQTCHVCMAGAHLAHLIGDPEDDHGSPHDFYERERERDPNIDDLSAYDSNVAFKEATAAAERVSAFDNLRRGWVGSFLANYGADFSEITKLRLDAPDYPGEYDKNPEAFKAWVSDIADYLEAKGH